MRKKKKTACLAAVCALLLLSLTVWALNLGKLPKNKLRAQDFVYNEQGYLTCLATRAVRGIDVSQHQGQIDFEAVKASGVEFVIVRVGYRGYHSGELHEDKQAQENYRRAKEAGLQVGAYFFSQAVSPEEAKEEALFFLSQIQDWELELWAVYDWESMGDTARTAHVDARTLTDCAKTFSETVSGAGYRPMVYFNRSQALDRMYLRELKDYGAWLALYSEPIESYPYRIDLWQYTNTGSVPGISGNVDINLWFPENG